MENLLDKDTVIRVKEYLLKYDPNLKIIVLNSTAKTAANAANSLKCDIGAIIKSLLLKIDNSFLICLVPGDKRCSFKKIKKILKRDKILMASAQEVKANTGFTIGGVSPVAHLNRIKILIDSSLSRYENVYAAAGHPNSIFKIGYKQLIELTKGKEEDII